MELYKIAKTIRSKNAGAFMIAIDIFFDNPEIYQAVVRADVLTEKAIAGIYHLPEKDVNRYCCENALAIKFSMPRNSPIGDFNQEKDLFGGQYYGPLVYFNISDDCFTDTQRQVLESRRRLV